MSKFMLLLKQNYMQKLKGKSFLITTGLYIVGLLLLFFWQDIKAAVFTDEVDQYAYVNETNFEVSELLPSEDVQWQQETSQETVKSALQNNDYQGAVVFADRDGQLVATIVSVDPLPLTQQQLLSATISTIGQSYAMAQLQLTAEQAERLMNTMPIIETETLNEGTGSQGGKSEEEKTAGIFASYVVGFIIYIFVISYLSIMTSDIASEKGSRAMEMLLVSVKPETHFKAKVASVFLLALTQGALLFVALFAMIQLSSNSAILTTVQETFSELGVSYVLYAVAFLFITILMYLIIGALFGSLVSKVEEASQVMMPAMIVIIVAFYVMITAMTNPDTLLIKVFSYIPFTSGMVMPMRIGATDLNWIEPILSLGLLIATTLGIYKMSITFYKRSVLTYSTGGLIQKIKTVLKVTT